MNLQQMDFTNLSPGLTMLGMLLLLYVYFLPALLAFQRGHRRFWIILGLDIAVGFVQPPLLQHFLPVQTVGMPALEVVWVSFLYSTGPGWVALLIWALQAVPSPDQRQLAFRQTKLFDTLAALPLVVWFAFSAISLRGNLAHDGAIIAGGEASLLIWLQFLSLLFSILFCLLTVWLLLVRDKPVRRIAGALPRICAVSGTFLGVGMLNLPVAELSLPVQGLCFALTGVGSAASFFVLSKLGKSFSIVPEARRLVTSGPYAFARHPLYAAEIITVLGLIVQYQQPWALLLGVSVIVLQVTRSVFEERVLTEAFPEYVDYRARVKRFGIV
jgi:protein-S-isoprenylcysteine O-methyltransferase Ste14